MLGLGFKDKYFGLGLESSGLGLGRASLALALCNLARPTFINFRDI